MPDQRLSRARATLPSGYQFGDARTKEECACDFCLRYGRAALEHLRTRQAPQLIEMLHANALQRDRIREAC